MKLNVELLDKTMNTILANPEEWKQSTWRCATGMCFAGHAVILHGMNFAVSDPKAEYSDLVVDPQGVMMWDTVKKTVVDNLEYIQESLDYHTRIYTEERESGRVRPYTLLRVTEYAEMIYALTTDSDRFVKVSYVSAAAQRALGLTSPEADALFSGGNSLDNLLDLTTELKKKHLAPAGE